MPSIYPALVLHPRAQRADLHCSLPGCLVPARAPPNGTVAQRTRVQPCLPICCVYNEPSARLAITPRSCQAQRLLPQLKHLSTALRRNATHGLLRARPASRVATSAQQPLRYVHAALQGTASAKTRAEVSGGGRKPLQQKGSGQARKGSTRTPLTKGGGVVFGPKPKDWTISMNKKERRLAVGTALQSAAPDTVVVDSLAGVGEAMKTKAVVNLCKAVGVDCMEQWTLIVTNGKNEAVERCAKNIKRVSVNSNETLHFYDVLRADKIIMEDGALALLHERYT